MEPSGNQEIVLVEKQKTSHIDPMTKGDMRALLDLQRKGEFFDTKAISHTDITRRDIIEYAASRQMAYCLDQSATKLMEFDFTTGTADKLKHDLHEVIEDVDTTPDALSLTPAQREALYKGTEFLADDIFQFKRLLAENPNYVDDHLGDKLKQIPKDAYSVDTKSFPGAVLVKIHTKSEFEKLAPTNAVGHYIESLGEESLKGRIILLNGKEAEMDTEYHEYLHVLNMKMKHFENIPDREDRSEKAVLSKTRKYDERLSMLLDEKDKLTDKKESELQFQHRISPTTRAALTENNEKIKLYRKGRETERYFVEAEVATYSDPLIQKAFLKVKNELQAYSVATHKLHPRFITSMLGENLELSLKETVDGRLFLREMSVLKEIYAEATESDLKLEEIGFLITGARNLSQAAKFVYLHLQQAPKRFREQTAIEKSKEENVALAA